jgi:hypothetical protein
MGNRVMVGRTNTLSYIYIGVILRPPLPLSTVGFWKDIYCKDDVKGSQNYRDIVFRFCKRYLKLK